MNTASQETQSSIFLAMEQQHDLKQTTSDHRIETVAPSPSSGDYDNERLTLVSVHPGEMSVASPVFRLLSNGPFSTDGMWEPPKPWSPKALTPLSKHSPPGFPSLTSISTPPPPLSHALVEDIGYYSSPQVDWTPPKLPACAHSTPELVPAPNNTFLADKSVNNSLTSTHAPPVATPPNDLTSSSGYGSDCSGLFTGFSPIATSLYVHDGLDTSFGDVITALGTPPPPKIESPGLETERAEQSSPGGGSDQHHLLSCSSDDVIITGVTPGLPSPPEPHHQPNTGTPHHFQSLYTPPCATSSPYGNNLTQLQPTRPQPSSYTAEPPTASPEPPRASTAAVLDAISPKEKPAAAAPDVKPTKPKEPYFEMIAKAVLSSAEKRLVLGDIYDLIQAKHAYFRTAESSWRNVIRHNLSVNDCFVKVGRAANGRGCYWGIHPSCVAMFAGGDFRRREARRLVQEYEDQRKLGAALGGQQSKENTVPTGSNNLHGLLPHLTTGVRHPHLLQHIHHQTTTLPRQATSTSTGGGMANGYQYTMPYTGVPRSTPAGGTTAGLHMYPGQYRQAFNSVATNANLDHRNVYSGQYHGLGEPHGLQPQHSLYGKPTMQQAQFQ